MPAKKVLGIVIRLPAVRLSFPDLDVPKAFEDGQDPKYGSTFLLDYQHNPKHEAAIAELEAETDRMIMEAWPEGRPAKLVVEFMGLGNDRTNRETGQIYSGYEGMWAVTAKNKNPPLLLDKEQNEISRTDPRIYGGAYVNATMNLYVQDNKSGIAIRASVRGVQVLGYGDAFGSRASAKEFSDFDADDEPPPRSRAGAASGADAYDDGL